MAGRPNLFIVGAPKCGTTSLHAWLGQHPRVAMSAPKEPYFLGCDLAGYPTRSIDTLERYLACFPGAADAVWIGEASSLSIYSRTMPGEIEELSPGARVIIMLRHPADLMYALHGERMYRGRETIVDFAAALELDPERRSERTCPPLAYRDVATLSPHVERYLEVFGDRALVLLLDELRDDPRAAFERVLAFLGLDPVPDVDLRTRNTAKTIRSRSIHRAVTQAHPPIAGRAVGLLLGERRKQRLYARLIRANASVGPRGGMDPRLRARLTAEFLPEITRLAAVVSRDLSPWSLGNDGHA